MSIRTHFLLDHERLGKFRKKSPTELASKNLPVKLGPSLVSVAFTSSAAETQRLAQEKPGVRIGLTRNSMGNHQ